MVSRSERNNVELYPFQEASRDHLVRVLQKYPAALDASQTGTGKTYVALAVCKALGLRPAVVCPKSIISPWRQVASAFGIDPYFVRNYEALKTLKYEELQSQISEIRQKKMLRWSLKPDTLLIFDEFHRCKGTDTINSRMAVATIPTRIKVLALSATPASSPMEMNALGQLLNLHQGWNFWKWCRQNHCVNDPWGGLRYIGGAVGLEKIHGQIFPQRGTRVRISDIPDFPETTISAETYEIDDKKLSKIYSQMEQELINLQERIDRNRRSQEERGLVGRTSEDSAITIMLRARQQAELLKVPVLAELAEDAIAEGNSVAVFLNFNDSLRSLGERLAGHQPCFIHGTQSSEEREEAIQAFQSDSVRLIIANTAAGGVGVSLHDIQGRYPRVSLISPAYSAVNIVQCLGRVHRAGAKTPSIQKLVFASGCIEEEACKAVRKKINNINMITDGDLRTGIQFI